MTIVNQNGLASAISEGEPFPVCPTKFGKNLGAILNSNQLRACNRLILRVINK